MSKATFHMEHEVPLVVGNSLLFAQIIELEDYAWHGTVVEGRVSAIWKFCVKSGGAGYTRQEVEVPAEGCPPAFGTVEVGLNLRYIDSWTILTDGGTAKELPS